MLARALVVLLLVLNLGVAAWWTLRAPPAAAPDFVPPADVARLQLVSETKTAANAPAPRVAPTTPPAGTTRLIQMNPSGLLFKSENGTEKFSYHAKY